MKKILTKVEESIFDTIASKNGFQKTKFPINGTPSQIAFLDFLKSYFNASVFQYPIYVRMYAGNIILVLGGVKYSERINQDFTKFLPYVYTGEIAFDGVTKMLMLTIMY